MLYTPVVQRVFFFNISVNAVFAQSRRFPYKKSFRCQKYPQNDHYRFGKIPLTFPLSGMPAAESTTPMIVNSIMPMP